MNISTNTQTMINSIKIQNFQSHKDTQLEFHPGVNIIVGSTDSGKSAIIRALRFVVWNKPQGEGFRSHWGGDTEVVVETEEVWVTRMKSKTKSSYAIHYPVDTGKEPTIYKAFGADVPDEIEAVFNMSEINLQSQLDSPFLLSDTAGEVAKHFNRIAHIEKIDQATKKVKSKIQNLTNTIVHKKQEIERQELDLSEYEYLDKMEIEVEGVEEMESKNKALRNRRRGLLSLVDDVHAIQSREQQLESLLELEVLVLRVEGLYNDQKQVVAQFEALDAHLHELEGLEVGLAENTRKISVEPFLNDALRLLKEKKAVTAERDELLRYITAYRRADTELGKWPGLLAGFEKEFEQEFPDRCPLCDTPHKKDSRHGKVK